MNNAAGNGGCAHLSDSLFSFPLDVYPEVRLLNHMVVSLLIF